MSPGASRSTNGVTVVIPTLNRGGYLPNCLRDLLAQRHVPLELLVVDQSAMKSDEVADLVRQHPGVISYHWVGFRGLPLARNYGWRRARHEAIVYVDDDIRCGPRFVEEHLQTLREPLVGAVAGGIDEKLKSISGELRTTRGMRRWTASPIGAYCDRDAYDVDAFKGCNFSIWRPVLTQLGGFDEQLSSGAALYEDLEVCLRLRSLGYRIRFNGQARLHHLAAPDGGCRVPKPREYVASMAHNRALVIARHLRWFETPTAIARLVWLVGAYATVNRDAGVLAAGLRGFLEGAPKGIAAPVTQGSTDPKDPLA